MKSNKKALVCLAPGGTLVPSGHVPSVEICWRGAVPSHYEVLGVAEDADTETIRRAYVALAKANHPDRRQSDDAAARSRAEERIRAANTAWNVLRDPSRRRDYDLTLPGPSAPAGAGATTTTATARPRPGGVVGARPQTSGVVVPAERASLWRFAPVVVLLAVLLGILIVSAYAQAGDDAVAPSSPAGSELVPEVDDCVMVVLVDGVRAPAPAACGTAGALRVVSKVDTPRPCPPSTEQLPLSDAKTTLCLGVVP
jgi:hypothetical protein